MLTEAYDFRAVSDSIFALLTPLQDADWQGVTQFKGYTINDVIAHLYMWNRASVFSLQNDVRFAELVDDLFSAVKNGQTRTLTLPITGWSA